MSGSLFDTSVVPAWRSAGTVKLTKPARVRVGDPCHGLGDLRVTLAAGTWVWETRDANEAGESAHRVWEVRLRRDDQPGAVDWTWVDDYGHWAEQPAGPGDIRVAEWCGVDAGVIAWRLVGPGYRPTGDDRDLLDTEPLDGVPVDDGRLLGTSSGWGDGCYPVAVRRDAAGDVVEVRSCYITPDPEPVTSEEFAALLPGVFADRAEVTGPLKLHMERTEYTAKENGDPSRLVDRSYDTLYAVTGTVAGGRNVRFTNRYAELCDDDWNDPDAAVRHAGDVVSRLSGLWSRLGPAGQRELTAAEEIGDREDQPDRARGWITTYATLQVTLTLRV